MKVLLLALAIIITLLLASPVNMMPVQPNTSNTSNINTTITPITGHFSLSAYTKMMCQLTKALQTIWILLTEHGEVAPFEYCFVMNIINIQATNLTIEGRLFIDYQVLNELTVPLRDVVNYEANISNTSQTYRKLAYAEKQLNKSLENMQNMQNQGLPTERQYHNSELSTSDNSTINNTMLQGQCVDGVTNSVDEYRDLLEVYLGLNFAVWDLVKIKHELSL